MTSGTLPSLVAAYAERLTGGPVALQTLAGDASTRRYHRVSPGPGRPSLVIMEAPRDAPPPPRPVPGAPPQHVAFLEVQRYLEGAGFPVPRVLDSDVPAGLVAIEDLGDTTFDQLVRPLSPPARRTHYLRALRLIARLQRLGREMPDPGGLAFGRRFDFPLLRWELQHFREWLLEKDRAVSLGPRESEILEEAFDDLARALAASPPVLVHRDFQSRNLMVVPSPEGPPDLRVIDFQDALLGPAAYDVVALLRDSYVALEAAELEDLLEAFIAEARIDDPTSFRKLFHQQTLQRKLKDAGRFIYLDRVRGNSSFLRWVPATLDYVRTALRALPAMGPTWEVLARHLPELRG